MVHPWSRWRDLAGFWNTVTPRSQVILLAGVFSLFSSLAFIENSLNLRALTPAQVVVISVAGGLFPAIWAVVILRRMMNAIVVMAVVQAAEIWWRLGFDQRTPLLRFDSALFQQKLAIDTGIAIVTLIVAYVLFITFIQLEGVRFFATYTEMNLAADIHRNLVPKISSATPEFEFFGLSVPSGRVGGDLVDLVAVNGQWIGYVADVSGHGVPAGVVMSMIKSAARMRLACEGQNGNLLGDLNAVLNPLTEPNMFITFAYASWAGGREVQFGLAGHLPLLHFRAATGKVEELFVGNPPLSLLLNQRFEVGTVHFERGDILVIVTDGLTEVFDSQDRELGLEPLKHTLAEKAQTSLAEISEAMRATARGHGKQSDDQTVLLVRRK